MILFNISVIPGGICRNGDWLKKEYNVSHVYLLRGYAHCMKDVRDLPAQVNWGLSLYFLSSMSSESESSTL